MEPLHQEEEAQPGRGLQQIFLCFAETAFDARGGAASRVGAATQLSAETEAEAEAEAGTPWGYSDCLKGRELVAWCMTSGVNMAVQQVKSNDLRFLGPERLWLHVLRTLNETLSNYELTVYSTMSLGDNGHERLNGCFLGFVVIFGSSPNLLLHCTDLLTLDVREIWFGPQALSGLIKDNHWQFVKSVSLHLISIAKVFKVGP